MVLLFRALARLVTFLLLVALALAGLATAVFSLGSGSGDFSLPGLARLLHLPDLRDQVGTLLGSVEASGSPAAVTALSSTGAVVLALVLLAGALWPRRERLVVLERGSEGTLSSRRRALSRMAAALVEQTRGVTAAKVRVLPARRRGGLLLVRAYHSRAQQPQELRDRTRQALEPLTAPFPLRARVRPRLGTRGRRVE